MKKFFNLKPKQLLLVPALMFLLGCDTKEEASDSGSTSTDTKPVPDTTAKSSATSGLQEGYLDVLYTDSSTFVNLRPGNLVFSFIFLKQDSLTIHGWRDKLVGGFDPATPVLKMKNGEASKYKYGTNIYFGDILLTNSEINTVQRKIRENKAQVVYFEPEIDASLYIKYNIWVGNDSTRFVKTLAVDTGVDANPSPPRS